MKTTSYHISNLGRFASRVIADSLGYVKIHDSDRYASASKSQLREWRENGRTLAVRNAAATELANRAIAKWQAR